MAETDVDLVILGGGSGGYACALRAAELGMSVVLIDKAKLGGTCLHRGCIPTKALLHAAEVADLARESEQFGVQATLRRHRHGRRQRKYKDGVVARLYKGLQGLVKSRKIQFVEGEGRLVSPHRGAGRRHDVRGQARRAGDRLGRPRRCPASRSTATRVITSDHALKLDRVPASVVVLGGGVIGCRVRQRLEVLRRRRDHRRGAAAPGAAGGRGQLQAARARVPPPRHQPRARRPVRRRRDTPTSGVRVVAGERQDDRGRAAAGRRRPRPGLGRTSATRRSASRSTAASSRSTRYCQTNVPTISAVGDLIPTLQLAHVGFGEGILVAERLAGLPVVPIDYDGVPRVTYSEPEVASVGLTEAQAARSTATTGQDRSPTTSPATARARSSRPPARSSSSQAKDGPVRRRPHGRQPGRRAASPRPS